MSYYFQFEIRIVENGDAGLNPGSFCAGERLTILRKPDDVVFRDEYGPAITVYNHSNQRVGHVATTRYRHQPFVSFLLAHGNQLTMEVIASGTSGDRKFYWHSIGSKANIVVGAIDVDLYYTLVGAAIVENFVVSDAY